VPLTPLARYCLFLIPEALVCGAALWLAVSLGWLQSLTAAGIFAALLLASLLLYPVVRHALQPGPPIGARALIGRESILVGAAAPVGRVQLDGESWLARSSSDAALAAGTRVRVVDAAGLELVVEQLPHKD
jgi:membrane protein implicated in regulation of membrane protease activity